MAAVLRRAVARRAFYPHLAHRSAASFVREPRRALFAAASWPLARRHHQLFKSSSFASSSASPGGSGKLAAGLQGEFEAADADGDGVVSHSEFQAFLEKRSKPTLSVAMSMPREPWEMSNEVLVLMAARGVPEAQVERMTREVMAVDQVSWEEAQPKLAEIRSAALEKRTLYQSPYYLGVVMSSICVVLCVPLTFNKQLALWFNEIYVTADVPPEKDLETWLEVGGWTWNWVEPVIGISSFVLLLLQFSRAQMLNVRWTPYFGRIKLWKLKTVKAAYPQYNAYVLDGFLESVYN